MWLHAGRVILAPKDAPVDFDRRTITCAGVERRFDHYVKGGPEEPRLPPVLIGGVTPWRYRYRDNFLGVVPRNLNNIYLMGYTRPVSGGLANIIEMQGLLVHKLITRPDFRRPDRRRISTSRAASSWRPCSNLPSTTCRTCGPEAGRRTHPASEDRLTAARASIIVQTTASEQSARTRLEGAWTCSQRQRSERTSR